MYFFLRKASTTISQLHKLVISSCIALALLLLPVLVLAAPYGEGEYGAGLYSEDTAESPAPTPSPSATPDPENRPSGSKSRSKSSSRGESSTCSDTAPVTAPDLFQINAGTDSLTLFFSPVSSPRDRYVVSYGTQPGIAEHAFEFINNENGVIQVDVKALPPRTAYYFTVRAGNGCSPGPWSNELAAATGQGRPTYRWNSLGTVLLSAVNRQFRPQTVQKVEIDTTLPEPTTNEATAGTPTPSPAPQGAPVRIDPPTPPAQAPMVTTPSPSPAPGLLGRIRNFFQSLF